MQNIQNLNYYFCAIQKYLYLSSHLMQFQQFPKVYLALSGKQSHFLR